MALYAFMSTAGAPLHRTKIEPVSAWMLDARCLAKLKHFTDTVIPDTA